MEIKVMAKKDEVRTSENFAKYVQYIGSYEDGKYTCYEFRDESGNIGVHYQISPEFITNKKAKGMARLFLTKMGKIKENDICIAICKCREIHEEGFNQSAYYLNIDKIIRPLCIYEEKQILHNGFPTNVVVEKHIQDWDKIPRLSCVQ